MAFDTNVLFSTAFQPDRLLVFVVKQLFEWQVDISKSNDIIDSFLLTQQQQAILTVKEIELQKICKKYYVQKRKNEKLNLQ